MSHEQVEILGFEQNASNIAQMSAILVAIPWLFLWHRDQVKTFFQHFGLWLKYLQNKKTLPQLSCLLIWTKAKIPYRYLNNALSKSVLSSASHPDYCSCENHCWISLLPPSLTVWWRVATGPLLGPTPLLIPSLSLSFLPWHRLSLPSRPDRLAVCNHHWNSNGW